MPPHLLYGVVRLPLWGYAALTFALVQLMFLGVTLYLHRDQSHGGLILHPPLRHFFRFWLWFCSGTVTRQWVAVHRRHHAFVDQPGDPHSPVVFGFRRVLLQSYELYVAAANDPKIVANYGRGTPDDWLERIVMDGFSAFVLLQLTLFGVLARHPKLLDERARGELRQLVGRYEVLRAVVEFRDRLQQIWDETSASHARALEQLRSLCAEAEGSGLLALRKFARRLPTYVPAGSDRGPCPIGSSSGPDVM